MSTEVKDHAWWERYFEVGGDWERNGGRRQTRIFAQHFIRRSALPVQHSFSLLDVGCALGDALKIFELAYPRARLHGIDFSAVAISRCREFLGAKVQLNVGNLAAISGQYDVIYCSNTLEHFADFEVHAARLLTHCHQLFLMMPFNELKDGQPLQPDPTEHHQHSFQRDSFESLVSGGLAKRIETSIFACPGAWGWSPAQRAVQFLKNIGRAALGRRWVVAPRQILYAIEAARRL